MTRKRIAIACQGGGSQCAFVAGALSELFAHQIQDRFSIVGLSGTSGGAFTAALAWIGLLKQAHGDRAPIGDRILACWKDLSAQTPQEILMDHICLGLVRLVERGYLPSVASSPSSPQFRALSRATSLMLGRPEYTDLGALLVKHIDFGSLPELVKSDSPVLLAGAGDVIEGTFKIFSSARREITVEALLASAAIPNLFPAVWVDGHAYWDGIFAANPPVLGFFRKPLMGAQALPQEIWIIQVNRARKESVPEVPSDIVDRRNDLAGNLSLQHELQFVELVNILIQEKALTDSVRARFGVDMTEPIAVRYIRMSPALQENLDYPSKLSRQPSHIDALIADGKSQAGQFLTDLANAAAPIVSPSGGPLIGAFEEGSPARPS
jgi:NTE family protein